MNKEVKESGVISAASAQPEPGRLETNVARFMFWFSLLFLTFVAGAIHRVGRDLGAEWEQWVILVGLAVTWPVFIIESCLRFHYWGLAGLPRGQRIGTFLLGCLIPPTRLCFHSYTQPDLLWLPRRGWSPVTKVLRKDLERFFSIPMIVIALMILPLLALEYVWADHLRYNLGLELVLDIGTSIIWLAFTIEFITMMTVAQSKIRHCLHNWMDLAIVVLPILEGLPILRLLRLTRVMKLQQLTRLGRLYRLRGLLLKTWRAILVLQVIQRLLGRNIEKRLVRLKELQAAKEEELGELRKEIEALESELAQSRAHEAIVEQAKSENSQIKPASGENAAWMIDGWRKSSPVEPAFAASRSLGGTAAIQTKRSDISG